MKKLFKSRIFIVIITMIICISGTLYATTKYQASDVLYNPNSGDSMTVNEALNEMYNIKTLGNATSDDIMEGKTAVVKGKLITGTSTIDNDYSSIYQSGSVSFGYSSYAARLTMTLPVKGYKTLTIRTGSGAQYIYIDGTRYGGSATVDILGKNTVSIEIQGKTESKTDSITYSLSK